MGVQVPPLAPIIFTMKGNTMKLQQKSHKELVYTFSCTVSADEMKTEVNNKLVAVGQKAKLPGFRPGKVPFAFLEKQYGASALQEAAESFIQQAIQKAITDAKIQLASSPKTTIDTLQPGKDFAFSFELEVLPEIADVDVSKVSVTKLVAPVTDKEIDEALTRLADSRRETEPCKEKRPTKKGDIIVIDFTGKINGEVFKGGEGKDYYLELGSNTFIPGFEEQLEGAELGKTVKVNVTFPKDYFAKELAGQKAVFDVVVKELRKMKEVKIDDAFAKLFGQKDLAAFKEVIKAELAKEYERVSRTHLKRDVLDQLHKLCKFSLPEGMVKAEFDAIWHQVEDDKKNGRLDPSEKGKSDAELKKAYQPIAERRVALGLLLAHIAQTAKIKLDADEFQKALIEEAKRHPTQEDAFINYYTKNRQAAQALQAQLLEEKIMDYVIKQAKLTEKSVSVKDLYNYDPDAKGKK